MAKISSKITREKYFIIVDVLMAIILLAFIVYTINFIAKKLNLVLSSATNNPQITRFNFDGLKQLGITQEPISIDNFSGSGNLTSTSTE